MPIGVSQAFHVNVNCSDLERSLGFYRDLLGLTASTRARPEAPQDGAAFGLDVAQWDAWILHDARGFGAGLVVDLLEWQVPPPTGRPNRATDLGHSRLGFYVTDLDAVFGRVVDAGLTTYGEPHATGVQGASGRSEAPAERQRATEEMTSDPVRAVVVEDPDGMMVELVQVGTDRVGFVAIGVSDAARSKEFYADVLGFHPMFDRPPTRQPGEQLGLEGEIELTAAYLDDPRGTGAFMVELMQLLDPPPSGPAASAANQLGMYRLALYTDDIDRDHADLVARGVRCLTPPATLEMGPGIPTLRALMFEDPDGTVLELIEPPR